MPRFPKKSPLKKTARRGRKRVNKKPVTFAKKVLAVINKQAEDKVAHGNSGNSLVQFNSGINSAGDMLNLLPNIPNGTAVNERIGEKIRLKSHTIKGYVKFANANSSNDAKYFQIMVRQMIISFKTSKNFDVINSDPSLTTKLATLLQKGGTTTGFTGLISDIMADINTDVFTVHLDKKFYLSQSRIIGSPTADVMDNSKALKFFNHSMKVKNKLLHYDTDVSSSLLLTNYASVMCFGYCYLDGSGVDTVSTNLNVYYETQLKYEDM